ncbi:MAG: hypothetical protein KA793_09135 [Bacteroidales bacterium]|nr:hypothetical protein [Bacteroidales bacterium]
MRIKFLSGLIILLGMTCTEIYSQDNTPANNQKTRLFDVSISLGVWPGGEKLSSIDDFRVLAPESTIFNQPGLDEYIQGEYYNDNSSFFAAQIGIQPFNKKKNRYGNAVLRFGVSFSESTLLSQSLKNEIRICFDTLDSESSGELFFIDSIFQTSITSNYTHQQLGLNASVLFSTDNEARWSLFGGAAVNVNVAIDANTYISQVNSSVVVATWPETNTSYLLSRSPESSTIDERFRNKPDYTVALCIPFGIDFRMGNKSDFLNRMHLFIEMRPGIQTLIIPGLKPVTQGYFQQYFGVRVRI